MTLWPCATREASGIYISHDTFFWCLDCTTHTKVWSCRFFSQAEEVFCDLELPKSFLTWSTDSKWACQRSTKGLCYACRLCRSSHVVVSLRPVTWYVPKRSNPSTWSRALMCSRASVTWTSLPSWAQPARNSLINKICCLSSDRRIRRNTDAGTQRSASHYFSLCAGSSIRSVPYNCFGLSRTIGRTTHWLCGFKVQICNGFAALNGVTFSDQALLQALWSLKCAKSNIDLCHI